jgi:dipeptidyl aminopeptidase/acylaminoacyl peptidase
LRIYNSNNSGLASVNNRLCRYLLVVAVSCVTATAVVSEALGQEVLRVTDPAALILQQDEAVFQQPRWSPDGSRIAFTNADYRGIWLVNWDGKNLSQISDERSAGFGFAWSPDGSSIVARVARYEGPRRFDAVKVFDVTEPGERLLTNFSESMPVLPVWSWDGAHVVLARKEGVDILVATPQAGKTISDDPVFVLRGDRVAVARPAQRTAADLPGVPAGQPINVVASPDGRRVAFEIVGGNLFIAAVDGSVTVDLGRGHRPQWSPDGQWVVFVRAEDDGHTITASDLVAARADGLASVRLTDTPEALEMNPSWSPDGSRIVFDDRGALYEIGVSY